MILQLEDRLQGFQGHRCFHSDFRGKTYEARQCVTEPGSLQVAPERSVHEAVKVSHRCNRELRRGNNDIFYGTRREVA